MPYCAKSGKVRGLTGLLVFGTVLPGSGRQSATLIAFEGTVSLQSLLDCMEARTKDRFLKCPV
jgi:hypothetical protein